MNAIITLLIVQLCVIAMNCAWVKEMENAGAYEGDMILDPDEFENGWNETRRYASIKGGRWPGAVVPYVIASSIGSYGIQAIKAAIANYHRYTCIRWIPRTNQNTYASFYVGSGCSSNVGYRYGRINYISLARNCWHTGVTMHEMGHTMGLYHEQSRPDRDRYVRIIWGNIMKGRAYNFNKMTSQTIDSLGTPYDLRSLMHYGSTAFGIGGRMTIQAINPRNQRLIGNRQGFSSMDVKQLKLMYKCGSITPTTKPNGACDNLHERCTEWYGKGYCVGKYAIYMKKYCCLSCRNLIKTVTGAAQTTEVRTFTPAPNNATTTFKPAPNNATTKMVPTTPKCDNKYAYCHLWAKAGYCRRLAALMKDNCCKACRDINKATTTPPPIASKCVDENVSCSAWAARRECEKNPEWMLIHCKKSCDVC